MRSEEGVPESEGFNHCKENRLKFLKSIFAVHDKLNGVVLVITGPDIYRLRYLIFHLLRIIVITSKPVKIVFVLILVGIKNILFHNFHMNIRRRIVAAHRSPECNAVQFSSSLLVHIDPARWIIKADFKCRLLVYLAEAS